MEVISYALGDSSEILSAELNVEGHTSTGSPKTRMSPLYDHEIWDSSQGRARLAPETLILFSSSVHARTAIGPVVWFNQYTPG